MRSSTRRWRSGILILITGAALAGRSAAGQAPDTPSWGRAALGHMEALSTFGPRVAGSPNERQAAGYVAEKLVLAGYSPETLTFSLGRQGGSRISANVVAVKPGESPAEIIVGAHYDSEARGRGADDNASGVGILLEIAAVLRNVATPYTIRFVAFGAEESGLRGSREFVSMMGEDMISNTVAMINIDSVTAGDLAYVYGTGGEAGRIRDWVLAEADAEGLELQTQDIGNPEYPAGTTCNCSDHAPFEDAGIQYAYFESTNWVLGERDGYTQVSTTLGENGKIWHTPYDTLAYIEDTFPGRVESRLQLFSRLLYRVLTEYRQ